MLTTQATLSELNYLPTSENFSKSSPLTLKVDYQKLSKSIVITNETKIFPFLITILKAVFQE